MTVLRYLPDNTDTSDVWDTISDYIHENYNENTKEQYRLFAGIVNFESEYKQLSTKKTIFVCVIIFWTLICTFFVASVKLTDLSVIYRMILGTGQKEHTGFVAFMSDSESYPTIFGSLLNRPCKDFPAEYRRYVNCADANLFMEIVAKTDTVILKEVQ